MAASVRGAQLTEAHRLAQARLGARVVQAMRAVWPLLDVTDLDDSFERWLRTATVIIGGQRTMSARLAANYVQTFKTLELGASTSPPPLILAEPAAAAAIATSMVVTGPASIKSAIGRGVQPAKAMEVAEARSAASAMRHALGGGRDTITGIVAADRDAQGWRRVTSGNSCDFCSLLAGRGAVYGAESATFHAHDGCSCGAEPVYR